MIRRVSFFLILILVIGCKDKPEAVDTSNIEVHVDVNRFEQAFYNANPNDLIKLKENYPYLFPENNPDSVWVNKIKNKDELFLFVESQRVFGDFSSEKTELEALFKHVKYYYPKFSSPKTITLISNVDYENKVIYADSLLLISLDMYLGKTHEVYANFPKYLSQNYDKSNLIVDVAKELASKSIVSKNRMTFIEKMVNEGKRMYLIDSYLPTISDARKMGYTQEQLDWAIQNEKEIWRYFIDSEMLFKTDSELDFRFLKDAPFSKFYLEDDAKSPGKIGVWMGWQIVKSYKENNDVTLQEIIATGNQELFNKSKYKPKK